MKKIISSVGIFLFVLGAFPSVSFGAGMCPGKDEDGDHYFSIADPEQENLAASIKETTCGDEIGIKGYELPICDCPNIGVGKACKGLGKVLDANDIKVIISDPDAAGLKKGRSFNPRAADTDGDGIDNNCDGVDGTGGGNGGVELASLVQRAVEVLGTVVAGVSTVFLIWGAIMYSSAAGEEEKTRKARKTMTGAVVGLIIGVLAATLIGMVMGWVVG